MFVRHPQHCPNIKTILCQRANASHLLPVGRYKTLKGGGPGSGSGFVSRCRRFERNTNVPSQSTRNTQYCGPPPWPRHSMLGLRPPGFEFRRSCVWRAVSSHSSHHPQEILLAQFSLYMHKSGLKPDIKNTKCFIPKISAIEGIHDTISNPILDNSTKTSGNSKPNMSSSHRGR